MSLAFIQKDVAELTTDKTEVYQSQFDLNTWEKAGFLGEKSVRVVVENDKITVYKIYHNALARFTAWLGNKGFEWARNYTEKHTSKEQVREIAFPKPPALLKDAKEVCDLFNRELIKLNVNEPIVELLCLEADRIAPNDQGQISKIDYIAARILAKAPAVALVADEETLLDRIHKMELFAQLSATPAQPSTTTNVKDMQAFPLNTAQTEDSEALEEPKKNKVAQTSRRISTCTKIMGLFALGGALIYSGRSLLSNNEHSHNDHSHAVTWTKGFQDLRGSLPAFDISSLTWPDITLSAPQYTPPQYTPFQTAMQFALGEAYQTIEVGGQPAGKINLNCHVILNNGDMAPKIIGKNAEWNQKNAPYLYDGTIQKADGGMLPLKEGDFLVPVLLGPAASKLESLSKEKIMENTIYLPSALVGDGQAEMQILYKGAPVSVRVEESHKAAFKDAITYTLVDLYLIQEGRDQAPLSRADLDAYRVREALGQPTDDLIPSFKPPVAFQETLQHVRGGKAYATFKQVFSAESSGVKRSIKISENVAAAPTAFIGLDSDISSYELGHNVRHRVKSNDVQVVVDAPGRVSNMNVALTDEGWLSLQWHVEPMRDGIFPSRNMYVVENISAYANVPHMQTALRSNQKDALQLKFDKGELTITFKGAASAPT